MLLKIAWRNIWRNKRRTYITITAIAFAVLASVFANSIQEGTWDHMINGVVNFHYGYVQVHKKGYWENQNLNNSMKWSDSLDQKLQKLPKVEAVLPRVEGFSLAYNYSDTSSQGVLVTGIDPEREKLLGQLDASVTKGDYLNKEDKQVLLAEGLAEKLHLTVGDTITLLSSGYHGANAAGRYPIKGLVSFGSPELNKQMLYLPLAEAQYFFNAKGLVTALVLDVNERGNVKTALRAAQQSIDTTQLEVMDYTEMLPDLLKAKELDKVGNVITLGILYMVIAFSILGTILMMTKERQYEFGVLTAIGMKRPQLAFTVWLETTFLGLLGALVGMLIVFPLVYYFHYNPIDMGDSMAETYEKFGLEAKLPTAINLKLFYEQAAFVFFLTTFLALYPLFKILRLKPMQAMRS